VMYWRELAWAYHALGDAEGGRRVVAALEQTAPGRLATRYFRSLLLAAESRAADAVAALDGVERLAPDPPLAVGEIAGRSEPERVATAAWVLYQVAAELLAHGDTARGTALAARAARWEEARPAPERATPESRFQLVLALELEGRLDSAVAVVRRLVEEDSSSIAHRGRLGVLAARLGDRATAGAADDWLARRTGVYPPGAPQLERARIAALLGDRARAMDLIETLPFGGHPVDVVFLHADPAFGSLRSEPRWTRRLLPQG